MESLDSQIKALQRKKIKIEMLREVQAFVSSLKDSTEHEGLRDELKAHFDEHINNEVLVIQGLRGAQKPARRVPVQEPEATSDEQEELPREEAPRPAKVIKPATDLVGFVQKYGRLGFKKVRAKSLTGEDVNGTVVRVSYPHIEIQLASGDSIEADPETAQILEG